MNSAPVMEMDMVITARIVENVAFGMEEIGMLGAIEVATTPRIAGRPFLTKLTVLEKELLSDIIMLTNSSFHCQVSFRPFLSWTL